MILVKRWKETTELCKMMEGGIQGKGIENHARDIMESFHEQHPNAVWAQVELTCRVLALEEMKEEDNENNKEKDQ